VVGAPDEQGVLAGETNQGHDDVREPHNKSAIKVGKTQEGLDCLEVGQGRPYADRICFGSVHRDASGGDHKTQELNLLHVEQELLGFGVQVIFTKMFQDTSDVDPMIFQ